VEENKNDDDENPQATTRQARSMARGRLSSITDAIGRFLLVS
jgi:hypothetical protein